ncbi:MAG: hypothetical protein HYX72_10505 [Acidobacteria bacterium]|nr:hypothetical protein [Acidobacteriota bacterium]
MHLQASMLVLLSMAVTLLMVLGFRRYSEQRRREMFLHHRRSRVVFDLTDDHNNTQENAGTDPV